MFSDYGTTLYDRAAAYGSGRGLFEGLSAATISDIIPEGAPIENFTYSRKELKLPNRTISFLAGMAVCALLFLI